MEEDTAKFSKVKLGLILAFCKVSRVLFSSFSTEKSGEFCSSTVFTLFGFDLTIKDKSHFFPITLESESWINPKYLDSIVFFAKEVGQPTSTIAFSLRSSMETKCVCENHVENIAGETVTFIISRESFQTCSLFIIIHYVAPSFLGTKGQ